MMDQSGNVIANEIPAANFTIFWDGDLGREILDHTFIDDGTRYEPVSVNISKWDWNNQKSVVLLETDEVYSNNGTKGNPCFQADIFGDWREEAAWRTTDNNAIRIYTTVDVADYRLYTLMHDTQYRAQVACEPSAYNQPPCPSFYIGFDEELMAVPVPSLNVIGGPSIPVTDTAALEEAVAKALDRDKYTQDSYAKLEKALGEAKDVLGMLYADQDQVDAAQKALDAAREALVEKQAEIVVDKTVLKNKIEEAAAIDAENYTQASYAAMLSALEAARTVLADPDATQKQVDDAAAALNKAVTELVLKEEGGPDDNHETDDGSHEANDGNHGTDNDGNNVGGNDNGSGAKSPKTYDSSVLTAWQEDQEGDVGVQAVAFTVQNAVNGKPWIIIALLAVIIILVGSGVRFYQKSREEEE